VAPPKGCATHNGKKLQFLFMFCSFLAKFGAIAQALFQIKSLKTELKGKSNLATLCSEVFLCSDCSFWCGRCSESAVKGKKSLYRLASSFVCERFSKREHVKSAILVQDIPEGGMA
jgi:hypothetical protein